MRLERKKKKSKIKVYQRLAREEKSSAKVYSRLGFPQIAKDERRHKKILEQKIRS
jgi:hypothetical protein